MTVPTDMILKESINNQSRNMIIPTIYAASMTSKQSIDKKNKNY